MKFGIRKPNIKSSIKARTTGRIKRSAKKAINPFYGKRGMGYITNPKKAVYNKVYNKTSFGIQDILKDNANNNSNNLKEYNNKKMEYNNYEIIDNKIYFGNKFYTKKQFLKLGRFYIVGSLIIVILGLIMAPIGLILSFLGLIYFFTGIKILKESKNIREN
ncbi:MAG TPA: hypothetical protein OIM48_00340 [Clostridiaceae bacterium]|nr:hypothetical protein [Clostridiaceae bacterium]